MSVMWWAIRQVARNDLAAEHVCLTLKSPGKLTEDDPEIQSKRDQERDPLDHLAQYRRVPGSQPGHLLPNSGPDLETISASSESTPRLPMKKKRNRGDGGGRHGRSRVQKPPRLRSGVKDSSRASVSKT